MCGLRSDRELDSIAPPGRANGQSREAPDSMGLVARHPQLFPGRPVERPPPNQDIQPLRLGNREEKKVVFA